LISSHESQVKVLSEELESAVRRPKTSDWSETCDIFKTNEVLNQTKVNIELETKLREQELQN
jgi:hypothetical protein